MQNDIVRQQPKTEDQGVVLQQTPDQTPTLVPEQEATDIPEPRAIEIPTNHASKPVGIIVTALIVCALLCGAVIYSSLRTLS